MGDALTRYRVDYKGGFATSDLTGFSSGVSVNFASGDAFQGPVIEIASLWYPPSFQQIKTGLEWPVFLYGLNGSAEERHGRCQPSFERDRSLTVVDASRS